MSKKQQKAASKSKAKSSTPQPTPSPKPFRIGARNPTQQRYLSTIDSNEITFGLGPAGTGKTYLAVAKAIEAFLAGKVSTIILVRPAVEAGEKLGFLPGTLQEKVDPYLRPFYDAMNEMLPPARVQKMMEDKQIEVAPLAFMRGRTLKNAFIILDEAQNTTNEQMKMFLTRFGEGSKAIVTGDPSQVDLQIPGRSGLTEALRLLRKVEGVGIQEFHEEDVVRHQMVQRIVEAYESDAKKK